MANQYFTGNIDGDLNTNGNWSTVSGGTGDGAVPGLSDVAVFDSNSPSGYLSADLACGEISAVAGFTSTINVDTYTFRAQDTSNGITLDAGTFTGSAGGALFADKCSSYSIALGVSFGGSIKLRVKPPYGGALGSEVVLSVSAPTVPTVVWEGNGQGFFTVSSSFTTEDVEFVGTGNSMRIAGGSTISFTGDMSVDAASYWLGRSPDSLVTFKPTGSGTQTFIDNNGGFHIPNLDCTSKTSGTFQLLSNLIVTGTIFKHEMGGSAVFDSNGFYVKAILNNIKTMVVTPGADELDSFVWSPTSQSQLQIANSTYPMKAVDWSVTAGSGTASIFKVLGDPIEVSGDLTWSPWSTTAFNRGACLANWKLVSGTHLVTITTNSDPSGTLTIDSDNVSMPADSFWYELTLNVEGGTNTLTENFRVKGYTQSGGSLAVGPGTGSPYDVIFIWYDGGFNKTAGHFEIRSDGATNAGWSGSTTANTIIAGGTFTNNGAMNIFNDLSINDPSYYDGTGLLYVGNSAVTNKTMRMQGVTIQRMFIRVASHTIDHGGDTFTVHDLTIDTLGIWSNGTVLCDGNIHSNDGVIYGGAAIVNLRINGTGDQYITIGGDDRALPDIALDKSSGRCLFNSPNTYVLKDVTYIQGQCVWAVGSGVKVANLGEPSHTWQTLGQFAPIDLEITVTSNNFYFDALPLSGNLVVTTCNILGGTSSVSNAEVQGNVTINDTAVSGKWNIRMVGSEDAVVIDKNAAYDSDRKITVAKDAGAKVSTGEDVETYDIVVESGIFEQDRRYRPYRHQISGGEHRTNGKQIVTPTTSQFLIDGGDLYLGSAEHYFQQYFTGSGGTIHLETSVVHSRYWNSNGAIITGTGKLDFDYNGVSSATFAPDQEIPNMRIDCAPWNFVITNVPVVTGLYEPFDNGGSSAGTVKARGNILTGGSNFNKIKTIWEGAGAGETNTLLGGGDIAELEINGAGSFQIDGNLTCRGDWTHISGDVDPLNSNIIFFANTNQTITSNTMAFNAVNINNGPWTMTIDGDMTVNGAYTHTESGPINGDDILCHGSVVAFDATVEGTSSVKVVGVVDQIIALIGQACGDWFEIDKPFGKAILIFDCTAQEKIRLTAGEVDLNGYTWNPRYQELNGGTMDGTTSGSSWSSAYGSGDSTVLVDGTLIKMGDNNHVHEATTLTWASGSFEQAGSGWMIAAINSSTNIQNIAGDWPFWNIYFGHSGFGSSHRYHDLGGSDCSVAGKCTFKGYSTGGWHHVVSNGSLQCHGDVTDENGTLGNNNLALSMVGTVDATLSVGDNHETYIRNFTSAKTGGAKVLFGSTISVLPAGFSPQLLSWTLDGPTDADGNDLSLKGAPNNGGKGTLLSGTHQIANISGLHLINSVTGSSPTFLSFAGMPDGKLVCESHSAYCSSGSLSPKIVGTVECTGNAEWEVIEDNSSNTESVDYYLNMVGAIDASITGNGETKRFGNLVIAKDPGAKVTQSGNLGSTHLPFLLESGSYDLAGNALAFDSILSDAGSALRLIGSETLTYNLTDFQGDVVYYGAGIYPNLAAGYSYGADVLVNGGGKYTAISDTTIGFLDLEDGTFIQLSTDVELSDGMEIRNNGRYANDTSGELSVGPAGVVNNGYMRLDAAGSGTGHGDSVSVRSTEDGVQRGWSGAGSYDMFDVDVKDQGGTTTITVYHGTDSGNNDSNWVFDSSLTNIWSSLGDTSFNTGANWSLGHVPSSSEVAYFDGTSVVNCDVDVSATLVELKVSPGYTGTVTQGSGNALTLTGLGMSLNGGAFIASDGGIVINGRFSQTGGVFTGSALADMVVSNSIALANGTFVSPFRLDVGKDFCKGLADFQHNSGTLRFTGSGDSAMCADGTTFYGFATSGKTLLFAAGSLITVLEKFHTDLVAVLKSSAPGTPWGLNLQGVASINGRARVYDSDASYGIPVLAIGSVDNGGNTNWVFEREPSFEPRTSYFGERPEFFPDRDVYVVRTPYREVS